MVIQELDVIVEIQTGVTIGTTNGSTIAPIIGDNVFLGDGCKILGSITIAKNVAIGANAVVIKSITEEGISWGFHQRRYQIKGRGKMLFLRQR